MKKNFIKYLVVFLLLLMILGVSACGYTAEEKEQMENYRKTAEENAVLYIEDKYGFSPEILSSKCDTYDQSPIPDFSPPPTGNVYVELQDNKENRIFWVFASGEKSGTEECLDNYQYEVIEETVLGQMSNLLGIEIEHIDLAYGKYCGQKRRIHTVGEPGKDYGLVHDYFDGTNLSEVFQNAEYSNMIVCMVIDAGITDLLNHPKGELGEDGKYTGSITGNDELIQNFGTHLKCLFVNYADEEAYESAHVKGCVSSTAKSDLNYDMEDYYIFIREQYYICSDSSEENFETEYCRYEIQQYEDFYYIAQGGTYCRFEKADADMHPASEWNGRGFINAKKVYEAYRVESDAKRIYLFIPMNDVNTDGINEDMFYKSNIRIVNQKYDAEGGYDYISCITDYVGDLNVQDSEKYITATVYGNDLEDEYIFSLFIDEEEKE